MSVRRGRDAGGERGALMAGLMAAVAILVIFSLLAFQEWAAVLRRDNEAEMMFRAQDIVRAIQRYRKEHGGAGPQKLEDLLEPGQLGQHYLRHLYKDPLVKDGKWGLLYQGPGGAIIDPTAEGGEPVLSGPLQRQRPGLRQRPGGMAAGPGAPEGDGRLGALQPGQATAGMPGATGAGGTVGLPIAGVKTLSQDTPFRVYKDSSDYSQWLFTYLDLEAGGGGPGRVTRGPGQSVGEGFNQPAPGGQLPQLEPTPE